MFAICAVIWHGFEHKTCPSRLLGEFEKLCIFYVAIDKSLITEYNLFLFPFIYIWVDVIDEIAVKLFNDN